MRPKQPRRTGTKTRNKHRLAKQKFFCSSPRRLKWRMLCFLALAPEKVSWNPVLITIGTGILIAVVSFAVTTSQWGNPASNIATAGFAGILLGTLIFVAGCIWLLVTVLGVVSRSR